MALPRVRIVEGPLLFSRGAWEYLTYCDALSRTIMTLESLPIAPDFSKRRKQKAELL